MTPNNTSSSANSTQNTSAAAITSSTSPSLSAPSSSTSRPIYPRPSSSSNHPVASKSSLPTTKWHDLPRLQLAPPEHQKQPHSQVKQLLLQQQQDQQHQPQQRNVLVPNPASHGESPASVSSSRSASPAVEDLDKAGDKRKSASVHPNTKKRRTEQPSQHQYQGRQDYSLATHYPQAYYHPTASTSTSSHNHQSPAATVSHSPIQPSRQTPSTSVSNNNYSTFNEFQWRLLHLCSEFYEAATELIRSTPPTVLSQAFQLINNGTGTDPISVLNDARRACDMLITNPQSLAVPPPLPSSLPLPTLNSLLHLNARSLSGPPPSIPVSTQSPSLPSTAATPPYPSTSAPPTTRTPAAPKPQDGGSKNTSGASNFTSIAQSGQVQGTWKEQEIFKLKELAEKYRIRKRDGNISIAVPEEAEEVEDAEEAEEEEEEKSPITAQTEGTNNAPTSDAAVDHTSGDVDTGTAGVSSAKKSVKDFDEVDWDQVVAEFGDERSRHQILIKATFLGLKPSSSLPGVKKKKKKKKLPAQPFTQLLTNVALPPPPTTTATATATSNTNTSHGSAAPSAPILALAPTANIPQGASSATAFYNSLKNKSGVGTSSQYTPAPAVGPRAPGGTASGSKSTALLPSVRSSSSSDKPASIATSKAQSANTTPTVPPPTVTAVTPTIAPQATVGIPNVSAYGGIPPPPTWGYHPPSAAMAAPVTGQSANHPYYPYAGMYYPQGYPIQSYPIPGAPAIQSVAPVAGGQGGPPPPMFVQTHPHYTPPHARRNAHAPVGQTFYAYVPRTEENPGPKKPTKKSGAGVGAASANVSASGSASANAGPSSSTFVVPNTNTIPSSKNARSDQTATDRPASATSAATPKSTGAEPQLPP